MSSLKEKTIQRCTELRALGFTVLQIWECEFLQKKKDDLALREFLKNHELQDRLQPRDAFFGGRTNAIKLFYEGTAKYVDFTSLYPWVSVPPFFFF